MKLIRIAELTALFFLTIPHLSLCSDLTNDNGFISYHSRNKLDVTVFRFTLAFKLTRGGWTCQIGDTARYEGVVSRATKCIGVQQSFQGSAGRVVAPGQ